MLLLYALFVFINVVYVLFKLLLFRIAIVGVTSMYITGCMSKTDYNIICSTELRRLLRSVNKPQTVDTLVIDYESEFVVVYLLTIIIYVLFKMLILY